MPLPFAQTVSTGEFSPSLRLQRNCSACGFQNLDVDPRCQKCGRRLDLIPAPAGARGSATQPPEAASAPRPPAMPEHVRNEIHTRVERFKARRRGQTLPLPFEEQVLPEAANVVAFPTLEPEPPSKPARSRAARELTHAEPVISPAAISTDAAALIGAVASEPEAALVAPPAVEPAAVVLPAAALPAEPAPARKPHVPQFPLFVPPAEQPATEWSNFHIASLGKRLSGIGYDLGYILGGLLLFAAPFYWIAGKPPLNLGMLAAFICGALLISVLYGCLFMAVMGETPGMTATGLRVVSFGGHRASLPQRLLRVVGAVVSAGSFLMGYVWAFIDEERLSWHDHISKTVLTDSAE